MDEKVPKVRPRGRDVIRAAAVSLLRRIQPESLVDDVPVDVDQILEFDVPALFGVKVGYTDLSPLGSGVLGYTDAEKKICLIDKTLSDSIDDPGRRRFRATVGHEIGHCALHILDLTTFRSATSVGGASFKRVCRKDIPAYLDPEWQGWEYGRELLMPKDRLVGYVGRGYSLFDLAEIFDVNPAFVQVRLDTLKIKLL